MRLPNSHEYASSGFNTDTGPPGLEPGTPGFGGGDYLSGLSRTWLIHWLGGELDYLPLATILGLAERLPLVAALIAAHRGMSAAQLVRHCIGREIREERKRDDLRRTMYPQTAISRGR